MKLYVIMACYNRRRLTLQSLARLHDAARIAELDLSVFLYDDACTDGTGEAVRAGFPEVTIIRGAGNAFWANSMATAERRVLDGVMAGRNDYIVWLNDDVRLDLDCFLRLRNWMQKESQGLLVGAVRDPESGRVTYSGLARKGWHPLSFARVQPLHDHFRPVETFNGNFVLVPVSDALTIGGIDGSFSHALADIDYGLRAGSLGINVRLAPGTFGTCPLNGPLPPASVAVEWRRFTGVKGGGHLQSMMRILRKASPITWPVYVSATYALWWLRAVRRHGPKLGVPGR
ncbi:glycosyltransferase family 2 protein [Paenarthrobacter aromaticivorans]|uniref:glycosyltransferase family 2 protein n=1 Tax=Paenarthrobacter aromaticivorans TaxID=2849150 RepID=UPI003A813836